jgi:hypothetical protein
LRGSPPQCAGICRLRYSAMPGRKSRHTPAPWSGCNQRVGGGRLSAFQISMRIQARISRPVHSRARLQRCRGLVRHLVTGSAQVLQHVVRQLVDRDGASGATSIWREQHPDGHAQL